MSFCTEPMTSRGVRIGLYGNEIYELSSVVLALEEASEKGEYSVRRCAVGHGKVLYKSLSDILKAVHSSASCAFSCTRDSLIPDLSVHSGCRTICILQQPGYGSVLFWMRFQLDAGARVVVLAFFREAIRDLGAHQPETPSQKKTSCTLMTGGGGVPEFKELAKMQLLRASSWLLGEAKSVAFYRGPIFKEVAILGAAVDFILQPTSLKIGPW